MHSALVNAWAAIHDLPAEAPVQQDDEATSHDRKHGGENPSRQLSVTLARLRHTHLELHQRPVAHTERTLANVYLLRHRGDIAEYPRLVADVLARKSPRPEPVCGFECPSIVATKSQASPNCSRKSFCSSAFRCANRCS